ncbi:GNAT family N-acetyltransferase [Sporolactobacillus sp. THM7-4]|nr:GNAT family N-acetyltransferase [Sporolactobacillus sp. THM7-4]
MAIRMAAMDERDFFPFMNQIAQEYALEKQKAGSWMIDESLQNAMDELNRLLPHGFFTLNHYFFSLFDDLGRKVGLFWLYYDLSNPKRECFIYDFEIFPAYRNSGIGQDALNTLFQNCRRIGLNKLSLHVFAHNRRAIHVYEKLGFIATDVNMSKIL